MTKITYIPGEIANAAIDENGNRKPVTRTHHIFDDALNKPQSQVNKETTEAISDEVTRAQNAESGLNTRLQTVEELARISVGGGDIGIGTAADFESDDPEDLAKVPTVSAILGGANDGVYDISARHNGTKYADLAAALGTDGANVPVGVRKGGMSVKFVCSSDDNYVQFRCKTQSFSANPEDWAFEGNDTLVENPEYIKAITDAEGHLLGWIRKSDGGIDWAVGVPKPVKNYVDTKVAEIWNGNEGTQIDGLNKVINFLQDFVSTSNLMQYLNETYGEYIQNPEFVYLWTDNDNKIIIAIQNDGNVLFGAGVPKQIIRYIAETIKIDGKSVVEYLNETYGEYIENPEFVRVLTDKDGKILLAVKNDSDILFGFGCPTQIQEFVENYINVNDNSIRKYLDATFGLYVEDPEGRMEIRTDNTNKIISYRDKDGRLHEEIGITTNSLHLSESGMTEFQQALKDTGFQPGGGGDWSERDNIELPMPKHYSLLNIAVDSLPINDGQVSEGYIEYYDGLGNYFKMECSLEPQGQSSRVFARTGGKGNYTLDLPKDIKFGSWVPQDSFHLKGAAKDVSRGMLVTSYKLAYPIQEYLNAQPDRVLVDDSGITVKNSTGVRINDWFRDARCLPDGFPVEVYVNGEYWGLYAWQLKKHRKNYSMDKKDYTSFFIDPDRIMTSNYQNGIWNDGPDATIPDTELTWWTGFDIKGPKDLVCMDGSAFDGDNPKELIDSTSPVYDSSNKKHKGSQTTKNLIRSFQTKYLEVKALIDNDSIEDAKAAFNANFDYNSCMFVYIYNCLMMNGDSVRKNTLWGMYKSGKIFAALWDLDGMYGQEWTGTWIYNPSANMWNTTYANAAWPLGLFWTLYESEIKAAYSALRRDGIISIDSWESIVFGQWFKQIGQSAFERDLKRWSETPSYRENYTNTDYWVEEGVQSGIGSYNVWDDEVEYAENDKVLLPMGGNSMYVRYHAVQQNQGKCPVTKLYDGFPQVGGYYDSPKRWQKWMDKQIMLCDVQNDYFVELLADFTAYRNTDSEYEIECTNMAVDTKLSKAYNYIQGHITRHEIEVEGQTVSTYTIDGGAETPEDTSKTYTTVRAAIEAAASQPVDIPSENVYYVQARAKNINYHKK